MAAHRSRFSGRLSLICLSARVLSLMMARSLAPTGFLSPLAARAIASSSAWSRITWVRVEKRTASDSGIAATSRTPWRFGSVIAMPNSSRPA